MSRGRGIITDLMSRGWGIITDLMSRGLGIITDLMSRGRGIITRTKRFQISDLIHGYLHPKSTLHEME